MGLGLLVIFEQYILFFRMMHDLSFCRFYFLNHDLILDGKKIKSCYHNKKVKLSEKVWEDGLHFFFKNIPLSILECSLIKQ